MLNRFRLNSTRSWTVAAVALLLLYVVAIGVTWLRKGQLDGDLMFWLGMSLLLMTAITGVARRPR